VLSGVVDFVIAFALLMIMIPIYNVMLPQSHVCPNLNVLWLPMFLMLGLATSVGVGLWLSALNVEYRDVRYAVPFLTQFWMFATPIAYSSSLLDPFPFAKTLYSLNPMAGVVDGFRWALLGTDTQPGWRIALSAISAVLVLVSGAYYFRRMESNFADVV
jgi:lipopolysaccharide transport system permease protein